VLTPSDIISDTMQTGTVAVWLCVLALLACELPAARCFHAAPHTPPPPVLQPTRKAPTPVYRAISPRACAPAAPLASLQGSALQRQHALYACKFVARPLRAALSSLKMQVLAADAGENEEARRITGLYLYVVLVTQVN
jgi:hypothetical protein